MAKRTNTTRTLNPLPFENLESHRFEDLVRRLLYGFRDWIDIEPTGRGGSDDGFDIRAWQKGELVSNVSDEGEQGERSGLGRLWQVQGKREKSMTPGKIKHIVSHDIDETNPPYGYILAAATNISKKGYDVFRAELKKKGVRECFFWGKDYLEDQLALPENDEVLFTFFGISLSPKRRSRIADIKFGINNKNKILRVVFGSDGPAGHNEGSLQHGKTFLLRDIKDEHYPYMGQYEDFENYRRWEEHDAVQVTPTGVYFKSRTWYAYADREKCEWDFTEVIDQTPRRHSLDQANERRSGDEGKRVEYLWRHLPRERQGTLTVFGFVSFDNMLIIDDKGDPEYTHPHVFIDFGSQGPFSHMVATLKTADHHEPIYNTELNEKFKRITFFPKNFPKPAYGKIHEASVLGVVGENANILTRLRDHGQLYGTDGGFAALKVSDLIRIPKEQAGGLDYFAEVMFSYTTTASSYAKKYGDWETKRWSESLGRALSPNEPIVVYEIHRVFKIGDDYTYSDAY